MFESLKHAKENAKRMAVNYVIWAETELRGKTGAEKKAAVTKKLDEMVDLPGWLEWLDDILISLFIDKVCAVLNAVTGHSFTGVLLTENETETIAAAADAGIDVASEATGETMTDKIESLSRKLSEGA